MCGIAGIYNLKQKGQVQAGERQIIQKMTNTLVHRGPDDEGYFVEGPLSLGHRRLSIIDLSSLGHQPMFYDQKNLTIVYNGEVYNYLEIKQELLKKGYKFQSQTDTEVILASYQEWGKDCLKHFNGMWAFVIYDRQNQLLFGARDRMGVKPLYYLLDQDKFIFASEIKAILAHPQIKAIPNDRIVSDYLLYGIVDHSQETFFEGIHQLPAGSFFILKDKKFKIKKFWQLDLNKRTNLSSDSLYQKKFLDLFFDSIKLRLRSDVPLGTCLSGGLDSSLIVYVINDFLKQKKTLTQIGKWQQTFSACYDNHKFKGCDERKWIKEVTEKTKAQSHFVFPSGEKLKQEIRNLVWHQDYPFNSTSIYAQWNVFRLAQQNKIKVMLDGQGGDELFAGYLNFFPVYLIELLRHFRFDKFFWELFWYSKNHHQRPWQFFSEYLTGFIRRGVGGPILTKFFRNRWTEYSLFLPEYRNRKVNFPVVMPTKNLFTNGLYNAFRITLNSLLRYEDRNSLAFSIESRVPFLDVRLVEFAFSLPDNQKIRLGQTKWVMRRATKRILTEKIRTRQDKIGFVTPEKVWQKTALKDEMREIFSSKKFLSRGYYEKEKPGELFEQFLAGKISNHQLFWRMYNLEIWFQTFID